jgi:hypothetical protein
MTAPREVPPDQRLLIDLCLSLGVPFFWQGPGLLLITRRGLDAILSALAGRGVPVVGLDAFQLDGADAHPRLDLIFDVDRLPGFPAVHDAIAVWPDDVWVDVTLGATS